MMIGVVSTTKEKDLLEFKNYSYSNYHSLRMKLILMRDNGRICKIGEEIKLRKTIVTTVTIIILFLM